jgi:alpha 1,2-mannosyltransferase
VHSLAAALFLPKSALHWFEPIGYEHAPHNHCPREPLFGDNHCQCGPEHSFGACAPRSVLVWWVGGG